MNTQKKDIDRFNQVYGENKNEVFRTAMCYVNNNFALAEEITQTVFVKLYNYSDTYEEEYLPAWLITVTKNEALNVIEKYNRELSDETIELTMDFNLSEESAEDKVMSKYDKKERILVGRRILDDLYQMNPRWYEAVTLVYCLDNKQADVAEKMGISLVVLHSVLYRARKWLKKRLEEERDRDGTQMW